jgi:hypothetical protein
MNYNQPILQIDINNKQIVKEHKNLDEAVKYIYENNPDINYRISSHLKECLREITKTRHGYAWSFKSKFDETKLDEYCQSKKQSKQIYESERYVINKYPKLAEQFDKEKNVDINLNTVTYGSTKKVWWKCLIKKEHPSFLMSPAKRARCGKNNGFKCPKCHIDSTRVHDEKEKEQHIKNHKINVDNQKVGLETEEYVKNLLIKLNKFKNVELIGFAGGSTDCIVTLDNDIKKCLQIKTLSSHQNSPETYFFTKRDYHQDMLIIGVNKERTRFALFHQKEIKGKHNISIYFGGNEVRWTKPPFCKIFKNENSLLIDFEIMIQNSCDYLGFDGNNEHKKEFVSILRLEKWCKEHNKNFDNRNSNSDETDCYIDKIPIRAKYVSNNMKNANTFSVTVQKSAGTLNKKHMKQNYSIHDKFDYMTVEIGSNRDDENKEKYHEQFCFIPKHELIKQGVLSSKLCNGKKNMNICPPDYLLPHWSKKYWNVFTPEIDNKITEEKMKEIIELEKNIKEEETKNDEKEGDIIDEDEENFGDENISEDEFEDIEENSHSDFKDEKENKFTEIISINKTSIPVPSISSIPIPSIIPIIKIIDQQPTSKVNIILKIKN